MANGWQRRRHRKDYDDTNYDGGPLQDFLDGSCTGRQDHELSLIKLTEVFERTYLPNTPQHYTKSQGILIELRNRIKELAPELRTIAKFADELEEYRLLSSIVKEAKQMVEAAKRYL